MFAKKVENQILPFFYSNGVPEHTSFNFIKFDSNDDYHVYVIGSLYGSNIGDLEGYLGEGLRQCKQRFNTIDLPILDRMKASIFQSGDFLANHMLKAKEVVDDVDLSICIVAFKDKIVYVWVDGGLNLRIYRASESILVNSQKKLQFNGSTNVELGDILAVSFSDNLDEHDSEVENYVLEQSVSVYPSLFIDYQNESAEMPQVAEELNLNDSTVTEIPLREQFNSKIPKMSLKVGSFKEDFVTKLNEIKSSGAAQKATDYGKGALKFVFGVLMGITSGILDFFYKLVLRKNPHQLKRFQASYQKKNFQYLLIFMIFLFSAYILFFRVSAEKPTTSKAGNTAKTQQEIRASIQTQFDQLTQYYNSVQMPSFNDTFVNLKQQVSGAKSSGFNDIAYLDSVVNQAQTFEDTLNKVTSITKVDDVFFTANIPNAKLVDFSMVGNDVYAIDRANSQILKSSTAQQFEVFASDSRLTAMSQISCAGNECYILDEGRGLITLDIAKKTFTIFPNTTTFAAGATEITYIQAFKRLYTLVPGESKVIRYDKQDVAFLAGTDWNKDPGFGVNTTDFAIDGNIFEMSSGGILRKFFGGKYDPSFLGLQDSNPKLGTKLQIATTPARDPGPTIKNRFYVADSDNQMIAVYDKDLNASKQFAFKGVYKYRGTDKITFNSFNEIYLSDDDQFIYALGNNVVYKVRVSAL